MNPNIFCEKHALPASQTVVTMVTPSLICPFCERDQERSELAVLRTKLQTSRNAILIASKHLIAGLREDAMAALESGAPLEPLEDPNEQEILGQERRVQDLCLSMASFIAEIDASSEEVARYLEQRLGEILRQTPKALLDRAGHDSRKLTL